MIFILFLYVLAFLFYFTKTNRKSRIFKISVLILSISFILQIGYESGILEITSPIEKLNLYKG